MKLTYDPKRNIAHLRLREKTAQVSAIRVGDELNVDMTPDGAVSGMELLNANAQLEQEDNGALAVVAGETSSRHERPLAVREKKASHGTRRRRNGSAGITAIRILAGRGESRSGVLAAFP